MKDNPDIDPKKPLIDFANREGHSSQKAAELHERVMRKAHEYARSRYQPKFHQGSGAKRDWVETANQTFDTDGNPHDQEPEVQVSTWKCEGSNQ